MKNFTQKFDNFIKEDGAAASLFFLVLKLIFIITVALHFVMDKNSVHFISWFPSLFGGLVFSFVTVVVTRTEGNKILKVIFPVFDTIITLGALNIDVINETVPFNSYTFSYSILFSVYTGLINYAIGMIHFKKQVNLPELKNDNTELDVLKTDFANLSGQLKSSITDNEILKAQLNNVLSVNTSLSQKLSRKKPKQEPDDEIFQNS